ncbi:tripartite ATP-independent transporter DctM subunit [Kushneria sinocarnis]|uniref:TRAP transporter large permease protein n=1 Tax=Kushneria sinocarnis TaxID=595502 RepID=A0A420WWC2_9GAMM|nr:TRAP transporter large permease [Kushneria sinocarnis]RKR03411.1 tripartite ATP-independent transporter DctM subunit [Kushneria sinocarnis]
MTPEMIGYTGMIALLVLLALRVPVALCMLLIGTCGFAAIISPGAALAMLQLVPLEVLTSYSFSAIPMFILMGVLASHSGMAGSLFDAARRLCGGWKGGMAIAAVGSCGLFSAISGSSLATASTMSRVALPEMERNGYAASLGAGALAAGGTLGIMIPPSIALLLYAIITEQSVGDMFAAGFIPGLLGLVFYIITVAIVVKLRPAAAAPSRPTSLTEKLQATTGLLPFGSIFALMVLGIYGGLFTPTEGASAGAFATLIYAFIRGLRLPGLWSAVQETLALSAVVFFMIVGAETLGYFISASRISFTITEYITGLGLSNLSVLLCLLLLYFVLGCFMDAIAMLLITVPVVYPVITSLGIDPIWFGIVTVLTVELGLITPPVGMNVFVINATAGHVSIGEIYRGVIPFILADLVRLALLIAFPVLTTLLL